MQFKLHYKNIYFLRYTNIIFYIESIHHIVRMGPLWKLNHINMFISKIHQICSWVTYKKKWKRIKEIRIDIFKHLFQFFWCSGSNKFIILEKFHIIPIYFFFAKKAKKSFNFFLYSICNNYRIYCECCKFLYKYTYM